MTFWKGVLYVAGAGALGAICRYLLGVAVVTRLHLEAPWATLLVNVLGCFAFGVFTHFAAQSAEGSLNLQLKLAILTGFLGAFTTFSTYSFDTIQIWQQRGANLAIAYVLAQNFLGWLAAGLGLLLGRGIFLR